MSNILDFGNLKDAIKTPKIDAAGIFNSQSKINVSTNKAAKISNIKLKTKNNIDSSLIISTDFLVTAVDIMKSSKNSSTLGQGVINSPTYYINTVSDSEIAGIVGITYGLPLPSGGIPNGHNIKFDMLDIQNNVMANGAAGVAGNVASAAIAGGIDEMNKLHAGSAQFKRITPKEPQFDLPDPTRLALSWSFTPRSKAESAMVQNIINGLRANSLPSKSDSGLYALPPKIFKITLSGGRLANSTLAYIENRRWLITDFSSNIKDFIFFDEKHPVAFELDITFQDSKYLLADDIL